MDPERHRRIRELFDAVLERPADRRAAYLERECGADADLRREVEELLRADQESGFASREIVRNAAAILGEEATEERVPESIGPYRILRPLGKGGMGEVYLAEQTEPIRRRVAVKVVKQGMDTREIVARFQAERQALALMNHPNIAKVFDAGETERGRPYFVMEFVDGKPIHQYCDAKRLTTHERLELFLEVCVGVEHAHQKAMIHRDLKPGNILVAEEGGRPVPKIIDFGIAKATAQPLTADTMFTRAGQVIGTPQYMSPEQADPSGVGIDTRTDIYALGVVLYELLVGAPPFDRDELLAEGLEAILRAIREKDPPRPSTRLSSLGEKQSRIADARRTDPPRIVAQLRGDLDWILMKALEKDRDRRYATATAFSMDILRHLRDEPVDARPPSASYRLRKLVRRHRGAFAAGAAILLVSIGAAIVSSVLFVRAERASRVAVREAEKSSQVATFLGDMIDGVGPSVARGRDTEMLREILDKTSERLEEELEDQPEVEAVLRRRLGSTYHLLGEYEAAERELRRALDLQKQFGIEDPDRGGLLLDLGALLRVAGHPREADNVLVLAKELLSERREAPHEDLARAELEHGNTLLDLNRFAEAESMIRFALEGFRALGDERMTAACLTSRGNTLSARGDLETAETLYREALEVHRRLEGEDHLSVASAMYNIGSVNLSMNRLDEAETILLEALAIQERLYEGPHDDQATTLGALANVAQRKQQLERANSLARRALELRQEIFGPRSTKAAQSLELLGWFRDIQGEREEAEEIFREVLAIWRNEREPPHLSIASACYTLAYCLQGQRQFREALALFEEALEMMTALGADRSRAALQYRNGYARALSRAGRPEEAIPELRRLLVLQEEVLSAEHPDYAITHLDLGLALMKLKRPEDKEEIESLLRSGIDLYAAAMGDDHPGVWMAGSHLAVFLRDQGRLEEADVYGQEVLDGLVDELGDGHRTTRLHKCRHAGTRLRLGHTAEAERLFLESVDEAAGPIRPSERSVLLADWADSWLHLDGRDEAEVLLRDAYALAEAELGASHEDTAERARKLVELYEEWGKEADAARWRKRLSEGSAP